MINLVNDNLYETRKNLVNEIKALHFTQFNARPGNDKWSIAQVCHHIVLVEQAIIKAISWGLKQADQTPKEHKDIKQLTLDRTKKFKAPTILEPELEPFEVQTIIDMLNDSRKKSLTFLSTIEDESILTGKSVAHPAFGLLPLDQWIEHIYLHEQRHIEQIREINLWSQ